ncbi:MAG: FAD-dependent oxidoreductase [Desulfatiglandaceae bacterium]
MISDVSIRVNRDLCYACGICVDRCIMDNLRLSVAPCRQACPLNMNCQGYVRLIAQGREEEAASELRAYTPFAGILGRICTSPCEGRCEREASLGDGSVHIKALKRYLAETFQDKINELPEVAPATGKKVAVVGSGPAGMMAAYELRSYGHQVDVFESGDSPGGFLRRIIPEFRLPTSELDRAIEMLAAMGVQFHTGRKVGRDISLETLQNDHDAVVIAVGACVGASPDIPGCSGQSVVQGIDLLAGVRAGNTDSLKGRQVVIVGGGNTAIDCAMSCLMLGAEQVRIVCLENPNEIPTKRSDLALAKSGGIKVDYGWAVAEISNDATGKVALSLSRCLAALDEKGIFNPIIDNEGPGRILTADRVVLAVGQKVDASSFLGDLPAGEGGCLAGDPVTQAVPGKKGIFVAGDCHSGPSSVVEAFASGKNAAISTHRHLIGLDTTYARDYYENHGMIQSYESLPERATGGARCPLPVAKPESWSLKNELGVSLSSMEARREAERCLSCGRSFELNRTCWYCLPCEIDCPVQALEVRMPYQVR